MQRLARQLTVGTGQLQGQTLARLQPILIKAVAPQDQPGIVQAIGATLEARMEIALGGLVAQHAALVAKTAEGHVVKTLGVLRCGDPIHRIDFGVAVLQAHGTQQVVGLQRLQCHRIGFQGE
ncbi:hypothetical protein D3C80_1781710 [compost metagenome]